MNTEYIRNFIQENFKFSLNFADLVPRNLQLESAPLVDVWENTGTTLITPRWTTHSSVLSIPLLAWWGKRACARGRRYNTLYLRQNFIMTWVALSTWNNRVSM